MGNETHSGEKLKEIKLTDSEIILLFELEKLCNIKVGDNSGLEWAIASKEYLQKKLSMSRATVYRGLKKLDDANLIMRKDITYKGHVVSAISVNKGMIKERIKATKEDDNFSRDGFLKLPYLYLKAFKT